MYVIYLEDDLKPERSIFVLYLNKKWHLSGIYHLSVAYFSELLFMLYIDNFRLLKSPANNWIVH